MPRKSARAGLSQASTSSQSHSESRIEEHLASSQASLDDQVNNVVRYIVNNAGQNLYFRRADIQKCCGAKVGQQFQQVLEKATAILKNVYGYNILACDQTQSSGKAYIVSNALPYRNYKPDADDIQAKEIQKIVLLLILTHIYMSDGPVPDASVYSFLKSFGIDVNIRHPLFGLIKDYITNVLIKQKFLSVETDPITKKTLFSWGIRAETEINKHELLKFVCKVCKNRQPKAWGNQYKAACSQEFKNERLVDQNAMDVDEE
ncbi:hypothetical protein Zmor_016270 [Zophobas morio]|uniref:MAGE domain-containing protein n=1 Tax=Zophobas morio TaxID=2755281 RepID=A0AA38ILD9_9CUCU|nr:hypothetical protein Zmor_016270 [Zophobas morio]